MSKLRKLKCGEIQWVQVPEKMAAHETRNDYDWDDTAPFLEKAGIQAYSKGLYDVRIIDFDTDTNHIVIERYCPKRRK